MSVTDADRSVALYSILLDGSPLDVTTSRQIREVKVLNYLRLPDMCPFTLTYEKGREGQDEPIDSHPFDIGKPLEIKLGAREALTTSSLFKGEIVTLELNFGPGSVELHVRGFDRSHVLLRSRHVKTFQNQTSSDIVSSIAKAAGFPADCDDSGD